MAADCSPGAKGRERTLAVTVGPWGGVWFTGKRRLIWRRLAQANYVDAA